MVLWISTKVVYTYHRIATDGKVAIILSAEIFNVHIWDLQSVKKR